MERTPADKWHHIADRFPDHSPGEFERAAAETNREQLMRRIGEYRDGNATLTSVFELGADLGIPDADIQVITGRKPPRWDREAYLETSEGAAGTAGDIPRGTLYGETDSNRLMRIVREYLDGDSQYDLVAIWVYGAEQGWSDAQLEKMLGAKPDRWNRSQHIREKKPAQKKNPSSGSSRKPTAKPKPSQKRAPKPASTPAPRVATSTADRWLGFLPWSLFVDPTPQDGYWLINRWADLIVIAIAAAIIYVSATSPDGGLVGGSVIAAIFTGIGLLLLREFEEQLPPYVIGLATVLFLVIFGVSTSEGFNGNNVIPDRNQLLIYIIAGLVPLVGLRFWLSPFKGTGVSFTSLLAIAAIIGLGCYFSMPAWPEASMEGFVQFLTAEAAT